MNWNQLFETQQQLDERIRTNHQLNNEDLFDKKVLALLVEVGELANETRCFKFWSTKAPSEQSVILGEYVDGIHFILSIGLEKGLSYETKSVKTADLDITNQFSLVYKRILAFKEQPDEITYEQLFQSYLCLGNMLGFNEQSIWEAYYQKNKINHQRQEQGY